MKKAILEYFEINTKRLAIVGVCTALAVFFGMFNYVTKLVAFYGFLALEFSAFIYIIVLLKINLFFSILCVICSTWLRYIFVVGSEPIGLTTLMIGDCLFVTFIAIFFKVFRKYLKMNHLLSTFLGCIISVMLTAPLMVLANYVIFLNLYGAAELKTDGRFLAVLYGFNLLKYFLNVLIFLMVYRIVNYL